MSAEQSVGERVVAEWGSGTYRALAKRINAAVAAARAEERGRCEKVCYEQIAFARHGRSVQSLAEYSWRETVATEIKEAISASAESEPEAPDAE